MAPPRHGQAPPANRHSRGGGGQPDLGGIIERAQRLRERMATSLEADAAATTLDGRTMGGGSRHGFASPYGLPPSLDAGLIIDSTLNMGSTGGTMPAGGFDALGQLFFDKRPGESAGTHPSDLFR
jgi:hypothetical protein